MDEPVSYFECSWCNKEIPGTPYWVLKSPRGERNICYPCFKQYYQMLYPMWLDEYRERVLEWRKDHAPATCGQGG